MGKKSKKTQGPLSAKFARQHAVRGGLLSICTHTDAPEVPRALPNAEPMPTPSSPWTIPVFRMRYTMLPPSETRHRNNVEDTKM